MAKVLVLADPLPPYAPLTSAFPANTGFSFSGISTVAFKTYNLNSGYKF